MQTEQNKKAVIYCRVSTKEQVEEGNSLSTQEKLCRDYALKNGYDIAEVFIEQGESAKTAQRTELQKLLAYCSTRKHGIHAVIAYKLDRISRNTDDYSQIRLLLKRYGVEIRSTSEYFENTPAGRFMENIIANVAQFDNDVRTERCIGGMREAVREGRYVWTAPVGYQNLKIGGKSTIAPDAMAPMILKTFETVAENIHPVEEVRRKMSREGLTNKQGKPLSRAYFYVMLRNPLYAGISTKFGERHRGTFQSIISQELFDQVQRVLKYRKRRAMQYEVNNPDFPLRRLISHPDGALLTGCWCKGNSKRYPYYRFHSPKMMFRKEVFEKAFLAFLDKYEVSEEHLKMLVQKLKAALLKKSKDGSSSRQSMERNIAGLKEKQGLLIQKNLDGVISNDLLQSQLEMIDLAIRDAYSALMKMPVAGYTAEEIESMLACIAAFLQKPSLAWTEASFEQKIRLQQFAFPQGIVFDGINWRTAEICSVFKLKSRIQFPYSFRVNSGNTATNEFQNEPLNATFSVPTSENDIDEDTDFSDEELKQLAEELNDFTAIKEGRAPMPKQIYNMNQPVNFRRRKPKCSFLELEGL